MERSNASAEPQKVVAIAAPEMQALIDVVCRAHKMCLHLDASRSLLIGRLDIDESGLTTELEETLVEMRKWLLDQTGITC